MKAMDVSRRTPRFQLLVIFGCFLTLATATPAEHSELWGAAGEKWDARSRLPDFSFAGYHRGEKPLPKLPAGRSVQEFGAKGDGQIDDSAAFLAAFEAVKSGTIEVPAGRYKLSRILEIRRPGVVLRGAGPDKTMLVFDRPLNEIKPDWGATTSGERTSNYSWSGGFVVVRGSFQTRQLTAISSPARRGDHWLEVSTTAGLSVGRSVEVYQTDTADNSLAVHLYSGDSGPVDNIKGRTRSSLVARIAKVEANRVELDRPLRTDLQLQWKPELRSFEPTVTESGVENLAFEFPNEPYKGHFTELGFNAIALSGVANCWVRNVRILNADSGIFVSGHFNTIEGVRIESARTPDRQQCVGHHGISVGGGDNLVTDFDFHARFIHDLTVSHSAGNVFSQGRGVDLSLDHHRRAPYENLFTDLDAGAGTRLWKCGGGAKLGYHCGARGTFWNIRATQPMAYAPRGFGPASINVVGLHTDQPGETAMEGKWFEAIPPSQVQPANLHEAQLERRLRGPR
ncbi:MAG: glycosyl hydrolase family 28-related protein [Limisphaerales bacterium]